MADPAPYIPVAIERLPRAGGDVAVRARPGHGPAIVFLPGYASDMEGTKAVALDRRAAATGRAMIRFDYEGCGQSTGRFEDGTLARWRDDALAVIEAHAPTGPLLLVGSSMGGWLALLLAQMLRDRVTGLVGIAAAPDFTEWGFDPGQQRTIRDKGRLVVAGPYGTTVTTRAFWESGQRLLVLHRDIPVDCPARFLHGDADQEVPWETSRAAAQRLRSADVQTILVKGGDHRLSRPQDIALLLRTVEGLLPAR